MINSFEVKHYNANSKKIPIIVIPGFMTEGDNEWGRFVARKTSNPVYIINWKSFKKWDIFTSQSKFVDLFNESDKYKAAQIWAATNPRLNYSPLLITLSVLTSPVRLWFQACKQADLISFVLAKEISKNIGDDEPFILLGHSLGGRIVSRITEHVKTNNLISTIVLAGAIGKDDFVNITKSNNEIPVMGFINYHSNQDQVLKKLYTLVNLRSAPPVGLDRSNGSRVIERKFFLGHQSYLNNDELGSDLRLMVNRIQNIHDTEM